MTPTVSVIILSYNTKDLLRACLESLHLGSLLPHLGGDASVSRHPRGEDAFHLGGGQVTPPPGWPEGLPGGGAIEVIVVDNGSDDNSPAMVAAKFPEVKLVRLQRNLGFAAGNNVGLKVARGRYYLLLNSDTEMTAGVIPALVEYLESHPHVGLVTPKVILPDGAVDLACHRGLPTPWNAFTYFTKLEAPFPNSRLFGGYHQTWQDFNTPHRIEAAAATAVLVRKAAIDQIGLLDEQFFLYAEDLDWCKRLTDAGWEIVYYPRAVVVHHKSASGKRLGQETRDKAAAQRRRDSINHFYDTMKQFYEKHYTTKYPKWLRRLVYSAIDIKRKLHH